MPWSFVEAMVLYTLFVQLILLAGPKVFKVLLRRYYYDLNVTSSLHDFSYVSSDRKGGKVVVYRR